MTENTNQIDGRSEDAGTRTPDEKSTPEQVWQSLLAVRTLVLPPTEDIDIWLKYASLCRKHGRINHARSTLIKLLQYDPETSQNVRYRGPPKVMLGYLKYHWSLGEDGRRKEAFLKLMVGYLLGLGDRHPSNLMLHRYSGKILHIDFGDCFEASMNREKFPEKVPFRLTRMLVNAMEISGIEGNFRSTCENVMQVLRTNKDSVMAMMEAFVHDPLINWRLFNINEVPRMNNSANSHTPAAVNIEQIGQNKELPQPLRGARERELLQAVNQLGDANDVLNERAVFVMARMSNKLTGRDFSTSVPPQWSAVPHGLLDHTSVLTGDSRELEHGLSVKLQVHKLIVQAMSHENLCQNYVGWCPFW